jgi:protocatechuate 3,4-dioxygenase beta subunit
MWRALVLLTLIQGTAITPAPKDTASIEGVVMLNGSTEPLAGVLVVLGRPASIAMELQSQSLSPLELSRTATTDADGRFSFKGIEPGAYTLEFGLNGFVREAFGQRVFPGNERKVDLSPGESLRDVAIHLTPAARISGNVRDGAKRPLADVPVRLMRASAKAGERTLELVGDTRTNDRGEYRLFFITPGRYFLAAGTEPPGPCIESNCRFNGNEFETPYTYRFYPGVRDPDEAMPIDLEPGAALTGVDWALERQALYTIRGRAIDGATGQPVTSGLTIHLSDSRSASLDAQGMFEIRNIVPGTYGVKASVRRSAARDRGGLVLGAQPVGYAPVDVVDRDVDGVVIVIPPQSSIKGRLTVDARVGAEPIPAGLAIRLTPAFTGVRGPLPNLPAPQVFRLDSDGGFLFTGPFAPGDYRLEALSSTIEGLYVKAASLGGTDLLSQLARLPAGDDQTLDIRLGWTDAVVDGVVADQRSEPVAGIEVVLTPLGETVNLGRLRTTVTDRNGRFSFSNVVPGEYRASVRSALRSYAYSDPELQRQRELNGRPVHVTEQSRESFELLALDH